MPLLFFLLALLSLTSETRYVTAGNADTAQNLLRVSCSRARYRTLCVKSLSPLALSAKTPADLARASVTVCLDRAQNASGFVSRLANIRNVSKREKAALQDCVEVLSDSVNELRRTLSALQHVRAGNFRWQMSNAQTWVSAALTDVDTCVDGFQSVSGVVKTALRKRMRHVARVTSNTLYLINRAAAAHTGNR
ncbi:pectinesterase inhibitor 3-like [Magnolia sinica]|uniref:pectinesterase inhibitor 3-like n=1 Tax=Magnolia sinica TaxID=86752 RepID=UPI0026584E84|nr:pectinesterase inhibitor 3-like [Magnolia sinica]